MNDIVYILRISGNYADEFDVSGLHEISAEEAEFLVATMGACFKSNEDYYFGSDEGVQLNELSINMDHISKEDYEATKRVFGIKPDRRLAIGMIDLSDVIREAINTED